MNNNKELFETLSKKSREIEPLNDNVKNKIKERYKEKVLEDKLIFVKFKNNNKKYYLVSSLAITSMIILFTMPLKNSDISYDILTSPLVDINQNSESLTNGVSITDDLSLAPNSRSVSKMAPWFYGMQNSHFIDNLSEVKNKVDTKLYKISNLELTEEKIKYLIGFFSMENTNLSTDQYYKQYITNNKNLTIYSYPESLTSWNYYDSNNDPYRCNISGSSASYPETQSSDISQRETGPINEGINNSISKAMPPQDNISFPSSDLKCGINNLPNDKDVINKTSQLVENIFNKANNYKYSLYRDLNQVIVYATPYLENQAINSLQITVVFTSNGIYSAYGTNYKVQIPKPVSIITAKEAIIRANDSRYLAQEYYQEQMTSSDTTVSSVTTVSSDLTVAKRENKIIDKLYHPINRHDIIKASVVYNNYYQFGENILAPVWLLESREGKKFTVLALTNENLETNPQTEDYGVRPIPMGVPQNK